MDKIRYGLSSSTIYISTRAQPLGKTMHPKQIVLLVLGVTVLIFAIVIAIFWSTASILALPHEQVTLWLSAFGTWVAGLGTFFAAGTALWLAGRTEKIRMRCIVVLGRVSYGEEYCVLFKVTNLGRLSIIVDTIEWSIGTSSNGVGGIITDAGSLLKKLERGESAAHQVCWGEEGMKIWMRDLAEGLGITGSNIETLRVRIYTTTGHMEVVKPSKDFMKRLAGAINSDPTTSTK